MKEFEFVETENIYSPPQIEMIWVEVEKGFATSGIGGTEGYDPDSDEIEF